MIEEEGIEGADVVVVTYGITSRVAQKAIQMARDKGLEGRQAAPDVCLALPGRQHQRPSRRKVKALVMPELNMGQVVIELERGCRRDQGHLACRTPAAPSTSRK